MSDKFSLSDNRYDVWEENLKESILELTDLILIREKNNTTIVNNIIAIKQELFNFLKLQKEKFKNKQPKSNCSKTMITNYNNFIVDNKLMVLYCDKNMGKLVGNETALSTDINSILNSDKYERTNFTIRQVSDLIYNRVRWFLRGLGEAKAICIYKL